MTPARSVAASLLAMLALGCGVSETPSADEPVLDPYAHLYECEEREFGDVRQLSGPGLDLETGQVTPQQSTYVVMATMMYWKADKTEDFYALGAKVMAQANQTPGLIAYALGTDETCLVARSITVWESEEAMYRFVVTGAHGEATDVGLDLSYTGRSATWKATADEVRDLDWSVAIAHLDAAERSDYYE